LALDLKAEMPLLSKHPQVNWVKAYHPLLKLNHERSGQEVVPLTVILNTDKRILVISGPNAGGKSVCLKSIGLLQYMLQCGLLTPAEAHSEAGIFKEIMVDIGDEQSIENDLSTYSSHLQHMKYFTDFSDGKTLFLIDEFGTGTDPQFGGPLAESILNRLNQKNAFGVVTTHYSNLKNFAAQSKGLENACMLFDNQNMIPLYQLEMGKPGSSYAFEIAQKTGLGPAIIDYARSKVGDKQKRVDDLLIELEREKQHVNELKKRFEKKDTETKVLFEEYSRQKEELDTNRKKLLQQAKQEALSIISEANSRIENTIREIREKKADTETIRKVRAEIKQDTDALKVPEEKPVSSQPPLATTALSAIKTGSLVKMEGQSEAGEVEEINKGKALVAFGSFKTWIALNRLVPAGAIKTPKAKNVFQGVDINNKLQYFNAELNLIGIRGEEAMKQLQQYMDDAYILGFKQVRILHGKGYGILRKLVREYLKQLKTVESVSDEHVEMGGDGVSIVTLKV
jgi:DNA mismatch repair protein MutS2